MRVAWLLGFVLGFTFLTVAFGSDTESGSSTELAPEVFINEGGACFEERQEGLIIGVTAPLSCVPSCYTHGEEQVAVVLDRNRKTVQMQSRFSSTGLADCAIQDCGGSPKAELGLGKLEPGRYKVLLGKRFLGTLKVPLGEPRVCLGISNIY